MGVILSPLLKAPDAATTLVGVAQAHVLGQVTGVSGSAVLGQVTGGCDQAQAQIAQATHQETGVIHGRDAQGHIETLFNNVHLGVVKVQVQQDGRVLFHEGWQQRGQMLQPERHGSSNFDASLQAFFLVACKGFSALSGSQNGLGLFQAGLPGFCQGQASGGAVKQRYVQLFFQSCDCLGDSGLGQTQHFCCLGKRAGLRHGGEDGPCL